jgi:hypothetical protein
MLLREMLKTPAARRRIESEACGLSMIQELPIREQGHWKAERGEFCECSSNALREIS